MGRTAYLTPSKVLERNRRERLLTSADMPTRGSLFSSEPAAAPCEGCRARAGRNGTGL